MRIIYYKNRMYKIFRGGQTNLGVTNAGSITRDIAIKYGEMKPHKKGHGAREV